MLSRTKEDRSVGVVDRGPGTRHDSIHSWMPDAAESRENLSAGSDWSGWPPSNENNPSDSVAELICPETSSNCNHSGADNVNTLGDKERSYMSKKLVVTRYTTVKPDSSVFTARHHYGPPPTPPAKFRV